jgi:acetyl-CoA C-acetyltransferase
VDDIVMGVRVAGRRAGLGDRQGRGAQGRLGLPCAGVQLNRFCASGLEAVNLAAQKVRSGWEDLVVAGGVESMSRVPMGSDGGAWAHGPGHQQRHTGFVPQGIGADLIATLEGFTREDVDAFALRSQRLASAACAEGRFAKARGAGEGPERPDHPGQDEFIKPRHHHGGLAAEARVRA